MKKLGFGLMRLPQLDREDPTKIDIKMVERMADEFIRRGFTYFDTAYIYHDGFSENAFKQAVVARYPRNSFTIADKLPVFRLKSAEEFSSVFEEQRERCGVEYFDYYLLHSLTEESYRKPMVSRDGFEFVTRMKKEGKVRSFGFSFHDSAELLDQILTEHPATEFVQLQINYLDWNSPSVRSKECYEVAVKHKKPVIVMEPVKGGSLAAVPSQVEQMLKDYRPNSSPASWAIRFAASLENVFMVLSGMSTMEQLMDNTGFMKDFIPLNKKEHEILEKAEKLLNGSIAIPCTACRYCTDNCPKHIPIPDYFSLYNQYKQSGQKDRLLEKYASLAEKGGKASDCISCKQCQHHCPQHLLVADYLKTVAGIFEEK